MSPINIPQQQLSSGQNPSRNVHIIKTSHNNHHHGTTNATTAVQQPYQSHHQSCHHNDDGNSTDDLADAFSSSLANIAAAAAAAAATRNNHTTMTTTPPETNDLIHSPEEALSLNDGIINSNNHISNPKIFISSTIKNSNINTTTTTTTSSDDRDSSNDKDDVVKRIPTMMIDTNIQHHYHHHHHRSNNISSLPNASATTTTTTTAASAATLVVAPSLLSSSSMRRPSMSNHGVSSSSSSNDIMNQSNNIVTATPITTSTTTDDTTTSMIPIKMLSSTSSSLIQPYHHRESFHTIQQTFQQQQQLKQKTLVRKKKRRFGIPSTTATTIEMNRSHTNHFDHHDDNDDSSPMNDIKTTHTRRKRKLGIPSSTFIQPFDDLGSSSHNQTQTHNNNNNQLPTKEDESEIFSSNSDGGYSASYSSNGSSCAARYDDSLSADSMDDDDDANSHDEAEDFDDDDSSTITNHKSSYSKRQRRTGCDNDNNQQQQPAIVISTSDPMRPMLYKKQQPSISSEIEDFSSTFTLNPPQTQQQQVQSIQSHHDYQNRHYDTTKKQLSSLESPSLTSSASSNRHNNHSDVRNHTNNETTKNNPLHNTTTSPMWSIDVPQHQQEARNHHRHTYNHHQHDPTKMMIDISKDSTIRGNDHTYRKRSRYMNHTMSSSSSSMIMNEDVVVDDTSNICHKPNRTAPSSGTHMNVNHNNHNIPIMTVGCDIMAHVLTFLEPPEVLDVLTMPLSKHWLITFTHQPELWRVLCLLEPFKSQMNDYNGGSSSSDSSRSSCSSSDDDDDDSVSLLAFSTSKKSKFRLLYSSYVRCMKCLARIKEDAMSGQPLSVIDYASVLEESGGDGTMVPSTTTVTTTINNIGSNHNLQQFLSRARGYILPSSTSNTNSRSKPIDSVEVIEPPITTVDISNRLSDTCIVDVKQNNKISKVQQEQRKVSPMSKKKKVKYGHSKLTQRLLGPTLTGNLGNIELPWSYGIYSIVNWMVAYSDVEGIQTMCLRVLPFLLENEQQRITAQRASLTDIVLRDMVLFPESVVLHTAAFHTIVLLARPLGGQEGMLFHSSMVNSSGIFGSTNEDSVGGKSGIAILIDSMRRFELNEELQSMACWSLVNIALAPAQKEVLVKLGGIEVIAQAMMVHQFSAEVQFRALFALINLVIPLVSGNIATNNEHIDESQDLGLDTTEKEMLDEMVDQIIGLVVLSMKNYCSNEAILNRACLVLHNLSLSPSYHVAMLWTPNCYQMLEWCLSNYRTDQVLQQSAAGTLHRLQTTLSSDEVLRLRFVAKLQAQQKASIELANQEAAEMLDEQQHCQIITMEQVSETM